MWISDTIERGYDFVQQLSGKTQGTGLFGQEKEVSEPDNSTKVYFGYLALQFHKSWGKCVGRGRRQALGSGHDVRGAPLSALVLHQPTRYTKKYGKIHFFRIIVCYMC